MKNIAKIALTVFVSMLEVGYADDCRKELYEKYKAHSAEFIKLKNKCKPLLENVKRLADTYRNRVEYKEYEAIKLQYEVKNSKWVDSAEYRELKAKYFRCHYSIMNKELEDIAKKTQAYKAYKQADEERTLEVNATCKLFLDGVYDIDKAFERIARAEYKLNKAHSAYIDSPQYIAHARAFQDCRKTTMGNSIKKYFAEYDKALKAAEKALEPLETAFRNSPEVKEYVAECRGITFSDTQKTFSFSGYNSIQTLYDYDYWAEYRIIHYIESTIANRP